MFQVVPARACAWDLDLAAIDLIQAFQIPSPICWVLEMSMLTIRTCQQDLNNLHKLLCKTCGGSQQYQNARRVVRISHLENRKRKFFEGHGQLLRSTWRA